MRGDDVGHVDFSVTGFGPHAAAGGAGVSVPLVLMVVGDVIDDQGLVLSVH